MTKLLRRLKNLTVKQKMFTGFGVVLLILGVIAALTLFSLLSIQRSTSRVVEEHQPAVITSMQLSQHIKDGLGALGFYLLGKDKMHKAKYLLHLNQAQKLLQQLQSESTIRSQPKAIELVEQIKRDLVRFKSYQDRMFTFAENQDENFPAMSYAAKNINPVTQQVLQNVAAMIQAEELTGESPRLELLKTFYNMRYAWARLTSGVRAYLGFRGAPALDETKNQFAYFEQQVGSVKENYGGSLTLEQEAALKEIGSLVEEYRKHLDYVISKHGSDEWRQDAHLFRSEISPLLAELNAEIKELGDQQVADIEAISQELVQRSTETAAAVITMLVLAMAAVGLLAWMLATGIIRPMTQAVDTGLQAISDIMNAFEGRSDLIEEISGQTVHDEIGNAATTFHIMAKALQKAVTQQQEATEELRTKVNTILDLVRRGAEGDLTGKLTGFEGGDTIDELATGVQAMIDNLNALVTQVQQSGIRVTSSATEIAATAKQQEAAVAEQAASTHQIMATVNEISATSKELVHTMTEVAEVADGTAKAADEGHTALERMEATMQQMREATNSITSKLAVLNEKAGNINNVVTTINKVADQTNLLSLNAAIEAEKAGEYGRGFAVVATEIRRLADQTAVATWDIEQMVKEMQSAVSAGVMGMDKFSEEVSRSADEVRQVAGQLLHIIEQVQALTPRFESVSDGMQSQSQAADQISESMTQLNEIAQQTAESVHQSNQSIQQLKDAAHGLQTGVSKFRVTA